MNHSSKKAGSYLQAESKDLQFIFTKAKFLEELNQRIQPHLPPEMRKYCQVANVTSGRLTLLVANGSVATQIRFQSVDLLRKFKQDPVLEKITEIHCKVQPMSTSSLSSHALEKKRQEMAPLSSDTGEMIKAIAESMDESALKDVMLKIANRVKNNHS